LPKDGAKDPKKDSGPDANKKPAAPRDGQGKPDGSAGAAGDAQDQGGKGAPGKEDNLVVDPFAVDATTASLGRSTHIFKALMKVRDVNDPLVKRAVNELIPEGELVLPSARAALRGSHGPSMLVAARLVEALKPAEGSQWLLDALRRGVPSEVCKQLLDCLASCDSDLINHLFELADHRVTSIRLWSAELLGATVTPAHESRIQDLAKSRRSETRQLAARLLGSIDTQSAVDSLFSMCGDSNPSVCAGAADSLSKSRRPDIDARLVAEIQKAGLDRRFGYLCIAICLREELKQIPVPVECEGPCLQALKLDDPFLSAAAASCLASIGYRSSSVAATGYLESDVLPALVFAAGGERFFAEFNSIHNLALNRLALLSDRDFGNDGPAWMRWWREQRGKVRANRAGFLLDDQEIDALAIDVTQGQRKFTVRGSTAEPGPGVIDDEEFVLSAAELGQLALQLKTSKVLDASTTPGIRGAQSTIRSQPVANRSQAPVESGGSGGVFSLRIRQKGQRKEVGYYKSEEWPEIKALLTLCEGLRDANVWQKYRNPNADADAKTFLAREREFYSKETNPDARAGRLMVQILDAIPFLEKNRRGAAFQDLLAIRGLEKRISEGRAIQIAPYLADEEAGSATAIDIINIVSLIRTPRACDALVDAAANGPSASVRRHLDTIFDRFGLDQAVRCLDDPRASVRASAAEAIGRRSGEGATAALLEKLNDPDDNVRVSVLRALGQRGDKSVAARIAEFVKPSVPSAVLRAAIEALGNLKATETFETVWGATESPDPAVRMTALAATGRMGDRRFADFVATYWARLLRFPSATEERAAAREALFNIGGQPARDALRRCLESGSAEIQREVVLALAEMGDPAAVPALMGEVDQNADARVRNAIVTLTCADFFASGDPARKYREWWDSNRTVSPTGWFVEACRKAGCGPDLSATVLDSNNSKVAIPSLNEVLVSANEWYLRARASQILNTIAGSRVGAVDRSTSIDDRRRLAERYLEYYKK
jgi:HEAT repeat protein